MIIEITTETIKLSQLLKKIGLIETGGRAKFFIVDHEIMINGKPAVSRNQQINNGDIIWIDDEVYKIKTIAH
ncbi:RNA-binding S4 domain-containing protein [Mycoplasma zalophi]|uniref:RNA-binding S4 domain-containing protein n=1 Tax=Mycoplasma zalophi TaxID=191287 RepID=A0ABS6DPW4_9MOLU|nr:RNA-binding S4 domain-containing protein [Mycoplasma zalophi]MBU4691037.1 RNA-binding S4 domain-containing protein [Mycoplasma zalophi]MBU4692183.1 RNA-binding S4 domain-containing protein [Mycoplasma zalophi]